MRAVIILLTLFLPILGKASEDSLSIKYSEYIELVLANHPISKQSDLTLELGKESFKASKGSFDPELKVGFDQKNYDEKNYYQRNKNELSLNTRFGVQFRTGYEQNSGEFLNPEASMPANGLAYAGLSVAIGNGLLMDERRNAVNQAEIYMRSTEFERQLMLNELILDATTRYWQWYVAWQAYIISANAVGLAETRFLGIKESFRQGEAPAIDTLEAYILYQNRLVTKTESYGQLQKAKARLNNYLWDEEQNPLTIEDSVLPENLDIPAAILAMNRFDLSGMFQNALENHPKLGLYENKMESLGFKRRLDVEKLKPKLNLNYNFLVEPVGGNLNEVIATDNYKWGIQFSMPLFLREARGKLAVTKIQMDQTDLERKGVEQKINNELIGFYNELIALQEQVRVYQEIVQNYTGLLAGERQKFLGGESSVFLINSRENGLIGAEIKLYELVAKLKQTEAKLANAMGDTLLLL